MSVSSDSGDASEIFWPGYVDAVTNLAINLLFVIAVMSIITLATSLELMKKPKNLESGQEGGGKSTDTMAMGKALEEAEKKLIVVMEAAAKDAEAAKKEIAKLEAQQKKDGKTSSSAQASAAATATSEKSAESARTETVTAKQLTTMPDGKAVIRPVDGGLVVVFESNVVQLSEDEAAEVAKKLATFGSVATSKWQIAVVTPKGYSVASRVAFYRVNAVRSVLLKNGAQGGNIETRVVESDQATANNARVTVQRLSN